MDKIKFESADFLTTVPEQQLTKEQMAHVLEVANSVLDNLFHRPLPQKRKCSVCTDDSCYSCVNWKQHLDKSPIYRDFRHWWSTGKHGWTSASYDIGQAQWADFEPTIKASRDEYKQMFVDTANRVAEDNVFLMEYFYKYLKAVKEFVPDEFKNFHRWWSKQLDKDTENETQKVD